MNFTTIGGICLELFLSMEHSQIQDTIVVFLRRAVETIKKREFSTNQQKNERYKMGPEPIIINGVMGPR